MFELQRILDVLSSEHQLSGRPANLPTTITGIADHTDDVTPGCLFCAVQGTHRDGHEFVGRAKELGATAFLVGREIGLPGEARVRDGRIATALAAAEYYGRPAEKLTLIGVTGTNGKSTTVHIIRHVLNANRDVGSVGTLGAYDGRDSALYTEKLTTPGPITLQKTLAELVSRGDRMAVLEVSSHALDQKRLHGIWLGAGVFTNLSRDHLDYHATWEEYVAAKASMVDRIIQGGCQVVNADERGWDHLALPDGQRKLTFGTEHPADIHANILSVSSAGTDVQLDIRTTQRDVHEGRVMFPLLGAFNVSNAVAATACAVSLARNASEIITRLAETPQMPGRMENIGTPEYLVLRDYSHTPDALERAARAAKPLTKGRLLVLFGCGGDRDKGKRPLMGKIAVAESDLAIVTSDNPRTEDPAQIIEDIEAGMQGSAYLRIVDRREAIFRAVAMMRPDDCLLLAGKGHETYQVLGQKRVPFDERVIVADAIQAVRQP